MTKIADTTNTIKFDEALTTLAAQARTRYAGEHARIDRGLVLALNGAVTLHADGTASVRSASDAEIVYHVNGHCDCPDAPRAPEGRCKHRWAKCLVKRATEAVEKAQAQAASQTYYASYYTADGAWYQGTAQCLDGRGWVFRSDEDDFTLAYADNASLVLGGRCDIADAQRAEEEAAGGLAALVCGCGKARRSDTTA